jgi:hypothetical protein
LFHLLAVVIDASSRRVIGWALDQTVEDELTLAALRMAVEARRPATGLVHPSDRGSQYASGDYTELLNVARRVCRCPPGRERHALSQIRQDPLLLLSVPGKTGPQRASNAVRELFSISRMPASRKKPGWSGKGR